MIPIAYNLRSMAVRRTTTLASVLGIALVVFVLAAALMLSHGIKETLGRSGGSGGAVVLRPLAGAHPVGARGQEGRARQCPGPW